VPSCAASVSPPQSQPAPKIEAKPNGRLEPVPSDETPPTAPNVAPPQSPPVPRIEAEPADTIYVGAGGKLVVPREEIDDDLDDGDEIELVTRQTKKPRKPGRYEWIVLNSPLKKGRLTGMV
jgi:hypothetical protein